MIKRKFRFLAFVSIASILITITWTVGHQINARISAQAEAERQEVRALVAERQRDQLERQASAAHDRHKKLLRSLKQTPAGDSLPSKSDDKVEDGLTSQEIKIPVK